MNKGRSINSKIILQRKHMITVTIKYKDNEFIGNNQSILLEQLEYQNYWLSYSCRVGICGICELKLLIGEVIPITANAIKNMPHILPCSCIPKSSLQLE